MKHPKSFFSAGSSTFSGMIIAALFLVGTYFIWDVARQTPEVEKAKDPLPPTPEEKILSAVNKTPIQASELASICDEFPVLAQKLLRDRKLIIAGTVKKLWVKGVHSLDVVVDFKGSNKRTVTVYSDFERYSRANSGAGEYDFKYVKVGGEVVLFKRTEHTGSTFGNRSKPVWEPLRVVFRETDSAQVEGSFERVDPASLKLCLTSKIMN